MTFCVYMFPSPVLILELLGVNWTWLNKLWWMKDLIIRNTTVNVIPKDDGLKV